MSPVTYSMISTDNKHCQLNVVPETDPFQNLVETCNTIWEPVLPLVFLHEINNYDMIQNLYEGLAVLRYLYYMLYIITCVSRTS